MSPQAPGPVDERHIDIARLTFRKDRAVAEFGAAHTRWQAAQAASMASQPPRCSGMRS